MQTIINFFKTIFLIDLLKGMWVTLKYTPQPAFTFQYPAERRVETGSAITWKYPGCILQGDNSVGEFYSVATTNNWQQADTGTKMIHLGKNTKSTIDRKSVV